MGYIPPDHQEGQIGSPGSPKDPTERVLRRKNYYNSKVDVVVLTYSLYKEPQLITHHLGVLIFMFCME